MLFPFEIVIQTLLVHRHGVRVPFYGPGVGQIINYGGSQYLLVHSRIRRHDSNPKPYSEDEFYRKLRRESEYR
jgi:hypothetical protein